jgi:hypothetical protein
MKQILIILFLVAAAALPAVAPAKAANDYNFKLIVPPVTGDVEQVQLDPSQWSVTLTNFPSGVRRGVLEFVGPGGGTNMVLVAEPGVLLTPLGAATNGIGADFSVILSNGMMNVNLNGGAAVSTADTTDFYPRVSNPAGYLTAATGITNASVVGPGFGLTTYLDAFGTNRFAVDSTVIPALASNQTFSATNDFTGTIFLKGTTVISNSPGIIGDVSVTGTVSAANLSGALSGTNLTGIGSVATSLLARVSNNSGTIGGAGNYLVVTFDPNTGLPIAWTAVTGPPAGAATNAVTYVRDAQRGIDYNNVNGIIFTNLPYFTQDQSTNTVGFSNVVFDTVQLVQGGTNFVLHGALLSFTNATTQGGTLNLNGSGTLVFGGSISNLLPGSGLPTSFSYSHSVADSGSGSGTLTANTVGGDLYLTPTSNFTGQAVVFSMDSVRTFTFKSDSSSVPQAKEFKIGPNTYPTVVYEITASLGKPGLSWDFAAPHECYMIDLGFPWALGSYNSESESANLIIDQMDNQSADGHFWYPGNNTNFPALWVKAGGYKATSATGVVMNSDWINIGAVASTNASGLPHVAFIGIASNEDMLAIWPSVGMSTNGTAYPNQYSTNATDHLQFGTNRFVGPLFGHNGTFGATYTNVGGWMYRDETNGLQVVTVSTNFGGSIYLGPTNSLYQILLGGGPSMTLPVSGSTLYITNGQLVGTSTP